MYHPVEATVPPSTPTVARQTSPRVVPSPLPRYSTRSLPSHTSPVIFAKPTSTLHQLSTSSQGALPVPRCPRTAATASPTAHPALSAPGPLAPTHLPRPHCPLLATICPELQSAAANVTVSPEKVTASSLTVAAAAADTVIRILAPAVPIPTLMRNIAVLAAH